MRIDGEVSGRNWDSVDNSFVDGVDVELELSRDGNDGRLSSDGSSDELEDGLVVLLGSLFAHKIDLVLEDDDLVELHDLNSGQVLRSLGLRAGFVTSNEKESGVHDGSSRQHGAHENIVTGAIDKALTQLASWLISRIRRFNLRDVSQ